MKIIASILIWLATLCDPSAGVKPLVVPDTGCFVRPLPVCDGCLHDWKAQDYRNITYIAPMATPTEYQKEAIYITDTPESEICIRCGSERYNKWDGEKIVHGEVLPR